jgi:hypothetical protein
MKLSFSDNGCLITSIGKVRKKILKRLNRLIDEILRETFWRLTHFTNAYAFFAPLFFSKFTMPSMNFRS